MYPIKLPLNRISKKLQPLQYHHPIQEEMGRGSLSGKKLIVV